MVEPADLFDRFEPIDLETLDAQAALQQRVDNKYRTLEIDGRRASLYESVYFDTGSLRCFDDHVEGRVPRAKIRTRLYVETHGTCRGGSRRSAVEQLLRLRLRLRGPAEDAAAGGVAVRQRQGEALRPIEPVTTR